MRPLLSVPSAELRCHDSDRFIAALFAPSAQREDLFTLYAFAAALERVREPLAGHVRLQWWRDVVSSMTNNRLVTTAACGHPVVQALTPMIKRYRLDITDMLALVDAHVDVLDSLIPDTETLLTHVTATTDPLTRLSLTVLGGGMMWDAPLALTSGKVAVAATLVRWLRAVPQHVAQGRVFLPRDRLLAAGITPEELLVGQRPIGLATVAAEIAALATALLPTTRHIARPPPGLRPLLLPAITLTVNLARLRHSGFDLFKPRHAIARPPIVRLWLASLLGRYDWLQHRNGLITSNATLASTHTLFSEKSPSHRINATIE